MNEPLWTAATARARAEELVMQFLRNPDVLSPDEQALASEVVRLVAEFESIVPPSIAYTADRAIQQGDTIRIRWPKRFAVRS